MSGYLGRPTKPLGISIYCIATCIYVRSTYLGWSYWVRELLTNQFAAALFYLGSIYMGLSAWLLFFGIHCRAGSSAPNLLGALLLHTNIHCCSYYVLDELTGGPRGSLKARKSQQTENAPRRVEGSPSTELM